MNHKVPTVHLRFDDREVITREEGPYRYTAKILQQWFCEAGWEWAGPSHTEHSAKHGEWRDVATPTSQEAVKP